MHIGRTPGIADPSGEQVLNSPFLANRLAHLGEGEQVDDTAVSASLTGCLLFKGLGLGFYTRGRRSLLEPEPRHRPAVETRFRKALTEGYEHTLLELFGRLGVNLFRALFIRSPFKQSMRMGKLMLDNPASFTVPWSALVGVEYASALTLGGSGALFDPLLLTVEDDAGTRKHVLFIEREAEAAEPALPETQLFQRRARFEQFSVVLALLTASLDTNGSDPSQNTDGSGPLTLFQLYDLSKGWFENGGSGFDEVLEKLAPGVAADALSSQAADWLAQFPIGAALGRAPATSNGFAPALPADGWPFATWVVTAELAPWLDLL